ncbi:hypothetical protein GCM10010377_79790 [Streptomyces viridiviolaceus]|uniref:Uncharacterized protein n=1 Tax=Streptomyces viridiviolaceus TaxID=68282 RepID=A0ABW2DXD8_9ACTN|nr:hypothetical protein [Streptomyces viridiviolaceus]GHB77570.1 hypothetical protein GCM10010377_79790 [Streptomyces viridiviolaceus]
MVSSPQQRPFCVVGRWSGADIEVWAVQEALRDDGERSEMREEYCLEAEEAFGSVEVVCAASAGEAEMNARVEAVQTAARIRRDLTSIGRKASPRNRRSGMGSTYYY